MNTHALMLSSCRRGKMNGFCTKRSSVEEPIKSRLPIASLIAAGASSLLVLAINTFPFDIKRAVLFIICASAFASVVLGIAGLVATRGATFGRRVPAGIGIVLGSIVFLWSGLAFWLSTPF